MKKILIVLAALFATVAAIAQSSPGFVYGQTPSAAQWNSYFAGKMDFFTGALPIGSGGTGATTASGAFTNIMTGAGGFSGSYLRNNGTSFVADTIQTADVPGIAGGSVGSIPYQFTTSGTIFLLGNVTATPAFLTSTGTGVTQQAPTYTTSTGSGSVVLSTSPTLVSPALGTPASGVATNLTGTAASLTVGTATTVITNANLTGPITSSGNATAIAAQTGTGSTLVVATSPTFTTDASSPKWRSTAAKVLFQGAGTGATQLSSTQTTVPTCSSNCGTSPSVAGSDSDGIVTMGGTGSPASAWVVTFNGTWAAAPACIVQSALASMVVGKMPIAVVTSTTTMTVTTNGTAPSTSDKYQFICRGMS